MELLCLDNFFNYTMCAYAFFLNLPSCTYLCAAYTYILNVLQLILKDQKYPNPGINCKQAGKYLVYVTITLIMMGTLA